MIIVWSCLLLKIPEQLITKAKITEQEFALSVLLFFNNTRKILLSTFVICFLSPVSPSTFSLFSPLLSLYFLSPPSPQSPSSHCDLSTFPSLLSSLWSLYFPSIPSPLFNFSLYFLSNFTQLSLSTFSLHFLILLFSSLYLLSPFSSYLYW